MKQIVPTYKEPDEVNSKVTENIESVKAEKNVVANTFMSFQTWIIVAIMYLIIITLLAKLAKLLERRLNRGRA